MFFLRLALPTALLGLSLLCSVFGFTPTFPYGTEQVRGVSLGGWLSLEPWITPSLFDNTANDNIVDEYTFCQLQPVEVAKAVLKEHWDTFITESDFADIAAAGLNHVRIPISYWAFEVGPGEPYITGQLPYLQQAVAWAGKHGLKIIVDLHGVPGSQNGFDNSGQRLKDGPTWHTNKTDIIRSNNVIKTIANLYKDQTGPVPIIAPLNEPGGFRPEVLPATRQFWLDSYDSIRYPYGSHQESNSVVLIHDAFQGPAYWQGFMTDGYDGVMVDTHIYQVFTIPEIGRTDQEHIDAACGSAGRITSDDDKGIIVGEWTPAMNDCAKYLNGRGVGSRYDGTFPGSENDKVGSCVGLTGKAATFSSSYKAFLRKMYEAQVITYEKAQGWIQWTWKAEIADEWTYQAGLVNGWIPQNPTDHIYPDICG